MKTILQAIKLAPRFLFQIYFQPSRVYDFIKDKKKNASIYKRSPIFQGLFLGLIFVIPHYLWYNNIFESVLFAGALAFAIAFAIAIAGILAIRGVLVDASSSAGSSAGSRVNLYAGEIIIAGITSAVSIIITSLPIVRVEIQALVGAFAYAFGGALGGAFGGVIFARRKKTFSLNFVLYAVTNFFLLMIIYFIAYNQKGIQMKSLGLLFPISYLAGYMFASALSFTNQKQWFKTTFSTSILKAKNLFWPRFIKNQKESLLWGPIFALLSSLPIYFKGEPESFLTLITIAIGFLILPLFILHIPDYLLYLPVWLNQRKKMLNQRNNPGGLIHHYEISVLFKHEMIYFPLPGLHKIMAAISRNKQLGMKEAIKHITHLYLFTFQQKQAMTALNSLWRERKNDHLLIHYLLEAKNIPLLETLSKSMRLPELYEGLLENDDQLQSELPQTLEKRIDRVRMDMAAEEGYHLNNEMVYSLEAAHKLLTAGGIKDFYSAVSVLEIKILIPDEPEYFRVLKNTTGQLSKIKNALKKAEDIERFDTKRTVLTEQKMQLFKLAESTAAQLYEPFSNIWKKALANCAEMVQKEINLLHGSAFFDIQLINNEILTGREKQNLHFDIINKGQELGRDVSIRLQTEGASLTATDTRPQTFAFIETDQTKRTSFPLSVLYPGKATVKLTLTYSDRTRENKQEVFSFPVTITEKRTEFKKIENPYIAGPALRSVSPLFVGRDDIYRFVDENIIPSGQHHTLVCHGLRRTGKSSLLYRFEQQGFTDQRLIPINIDLQGIADETDLYLTLSEGIIKKLNLSSISPVDNFGQFKRFIKEIEPAGSNKIIVLMLDEFEELQMRVEDNRISRTVFSNIRHLMQHKDNIIFLFCGTHKIEEMKADYWSIFFNTALYRRIGSLPEKDAVRLIREPVKDQLNYDDLAVEQILTMTGRQPYLIQLLCRTIVNDLNTNKKRNDALVNDVDDAVEQIIAEDNDNFSKETWKDAGHLERMILSATAEELTHKHLERVNLEDILNKIAPLVRDFSREAAVDTLDKLVTGEILTEKNLNYWFTVNMTRKWIASRHPLRKVRE